MDGGAEAARARFRELPRKAVFPEVRAEDRTVDGVPVRIYWPADAEPTAPVVLFFHGGGWVVGDLDTYDGTARLHAAGTGAVVVSVDYRLAPEHPFPAAVDDVWAVTQWVAAHAGEIGGDPNRLAVAGDSAGGNLAAVVAQLARDAGIPLRTQLLWYPATTWDTTLPSFTENADAPMLNSNVTAAFLSWYLPGMDISDASTLPTELAPANAESLAGLPPAYIGTAEHDPLRDDGAHYAKLLAAAGVPVELSNEPTMVHGFVSLALASPVATEATERGIAALKAALYA